MVYLIALTWKELSIGLSIPDIQHAPSFFILFYAFLLHFLAACLSSRVALPLSLDPQHPRLVSVSDPHLHASHHHHDLLQQTLSPILSTLPPSPPRSHRVACKMH